MLSKLLLRDMLFTNENENKIRMFFLDVQIIRGDG